MESFSSKSLALPAEKLLSKMAGGSVAHLFMYETSSEALDELYRVSKEYTQSLPPAQRVIKDLIKVVVKVAVVHRSGCLGPSELALAVRPDCAQLSEVDLPFEAAVLAGLLTDAGTYCWCWSAPPHAQVTQSQPLCVFYHFSGPGLLTALSGPDFTQHLGKICDGLRKLLDEGKL